MTASLPNITSLMDQARAAVAELDTAIAGIDETVARLRTEIGTAMQRRRELVDQRRPIAAIIPGARPAPASAPASKRKPPEPAPCPHCGKLRKHLSVHTPNCPQRLEAMAPPAEAFPQELPAAPHVDEVLAEPAPPVTPSPAPVAGPLDADIAALFEKHHRESFTRRCRLAADALGKPPSQVRGVAARLGLA